MSQGTITPAQIEPQLLRNYCRRLVNQFFKILPIRERGDSTLITYMRSLRAEMLGCQSLAAQLHEDAIYITMLSILQYLIDRPDCPVKDVKREVFKAIELCEVLIDELADKEESEAKGA